MGRNRPALEQVTLVAISSVNVRRTIAALRETMRRAEFGRVLFLTHERPRWMDRRIEYAQIGQLTSADAYSRFVIEHLASYIETPHCLIVQADGYATNRRGWTNEFLEYDYIGAPWPDGNDAFLDPFGVHQRVGNGGFSLRSRKLLVLAAERVPVGVDESDGTSRLHHEDVELCVTHRAMLEKAGCRFAPVDVAARFSTEWIVPESRPREAFGFHGAHPYRRGWSKTDWLRGWGPGIV